MYWNHSLRLRLLLVLALLRQKHRLLACRKTYLLEWREHRL